MSLEEYYKMVVDEDGDEIEITDKELALKLLKIGSTIIEYLSDDLMKDRDIILQGVKTDGLIISFDKYGVCDREIALECIKHKDAFKYLRKEFKKNREIAFKAVELHPHNFIYLCDELKNDKDFNELKRHR